MRLALAAHEEVDVLQRLCEGKKVPDELRLPLWKVRGDDEEREREVINMVCL